jgi:hypothetical protein
MASATDVLNALVAAVNAAIFPNGTQSITGACAQIIPGWPDATALGTALKAGTSVVSVFPLKARNTTRYLQRWMTGVVNTPTLSTFIQGQTVTIQGDVPLPTNQHHISIGIDGNPYPYLVPQGFSIAQIAANMAALIAADFPGTTSGNNIINIPSPAVINFARVGVTGTSVKLIANIEQQFQITVFASTADNRSQLADALEVALCSLTFIDLPDLTSGRIRFFGDNWSDNYLKMGIFQRSLVYTVDYSVTQVIQTPTITQETINVYTGLAALPATSATNWTTDTTAVTTDSTQFTTDSDGPPAVTINV